MEGWERPVTHHRRNPSFSSSLLDAIDRSIGEADFSGYLTGGALDSTKTVTTLSYYAGSARFTPPKPVRIQTKANPIQTNPPPPIPDPNKKNPKKKLADFMRSSKSTSPISPGAKLAGFLNSLFSPSNHKKPKISISSTESPSSSSSICSSVSSYSRSCLSKTQSSRGSKRSVRFSPAVVFDGEAAAAAEERGRRRAVEEMMKGFEESEGDESDGSEDLFELENLEGVGNGGLGLGFRAELPVFGTTDMGMNCAIAKGLVV